MKGKQKLLPYLDLTKPSRRLTIEQKQRRI
jgi:hypothetical protein